MKTLMGHFDGVNIVLDEPADLSPNTKVCIVVNDQDISDEDLVKASARLSSQAFNDIWDNPLDADYDKI